MNTEKKIRYGIIGFGLFAERKIAPAIRKSPNSELVAIQKRSIDQARAKAAEHNIPHAFDNAEALVSHNDLDAVFIVSANSEHCRETVTAARHGKHVIVEKPMAIDVAEANQMIEACKEADVRLMVGHMVRLSPVMLRMKELISSGQLGAISHVRTEFMYDGRETHRQWLTDRSIAGGGPVFDIGVHCLDTMRAVLEDEVISVKSELRPRPTKTRTESTATISLQFSRGTLGSIFCTYEAPIRRSRIEVIGSEGVLFAENFTVGEQTTQLHVTQRKNGGKESHSIEAFDVPDLYVKEVSMFSESVMRKTDTELSGENGLENQKVIDAIMSGL